MLVYIPFGMEPQATNDFFFEFHCNLARLKINIEINDFYTEPSQ